VTLGTIGRQARACVSHQCCIQPSPILSDNSKRSMSAPVIRGLMARLTRCVSSFRHLLPLARHTQPHLVTLPTNPQPNTSPTCNASPSKNPNPNPNPTRLQGNPRILKHLQSIVERRGLQYTLVLLSEVSAVQAVCLHVSLPAMPHGHDGLLSAAACTGGWCLYVCVCLCVCLTSNKIWWCWHCAVLLCDCLMIYWGGGAGGSAM